MDSLKSAPENYSAPSMKFHVIGKMVKLSLSSLEYYKDRNIKAGSCNKVSQTSKQWSSLLKLKIHYSQNQAGNVHFVLFRCLY